MARLVTALAVAMAVVYPAHAETRRSSFTEPVPSLAEDASIVIGTPTQSANIDRVHVALEAHADSTRARLTIVLSTKSSRAVSTEMSLSVPAGSRVMSLSMTLGHAPRTTSTALPAFEGWQRYWRARETVIDPALLSYDRSNGIHDRLILQVFPLVRGHSAVVELDVEVPTSRPLLVDTHQVVRRFAIERVRPGTLAFAEGPSVDEHTSLFVGPEPRQPLVIACSFGGTSSAVGSLDAREVKREIRRHREQLGYCYSHELQSHQTLAGSAVMRLRLLPDGSTQVKDVDGDLDSDIVKRCIADQAAQWRFHEHDEIIDVSYPLTFVIGGVAAGDGRS